MVPGVHAAAGVGQDGMLGVLRKRVQPRVVDGYELQWQAAAISALDRLQVELQVQVVTYYSTQCAAGQELFVREWQRKTSGILSHRKKKEKQRSKYCVEIDQDHQECPGNLFEFIGAVQGSGQWQHAAADEAAGSN
jgi:hypothetical protein